MSSDSEISQNASTIENEITSHAKSIESFKEVLRAEFAYQTGGGLEIIPIFEEILEDERKEASLRAYEEIKQEILKNFASNSTNAATGKNETDRVYFLGQRDQDTILLEFIDLRRRGLEK